MAGTLALPYAPVNAIMLTSAPQNRAGRRRPREVRPAQTPDRDWHRGMRDWVADPDVRAGAASLVFHTLLLTALSLTVIHHSRGEGVFSLSAHQGSESGEAGLEGLLGEEIASIGGSPDEVRATVVSGTQPTIDSIRAELSVESILGEMEISEMAPETGDLLSEVDVDGLGGGGRGKGKGSSVGNMVEGFSRPGGGKVARKGKFAAWTVPTDPQPRQPYLIVIEVQWPKTKDRKQLQARKTDLTGTVEGTDDWFQIIEQTGRFIPRSSQMVIPVPGAERYVQDTIKVRSRILDEEQELHITF